MKIGILRTFCLILLVHLTVCINLDNCRCDQCSHVQDVKDQCGCCVYLLHGKRSGLDTSSRIQAQDTGNDRHYDSYMLEMLHPFDIKRRTAAVNKIIAEPPKLWQSLTKRVVDLTEPIADIVYDFEN